jgi:glycosyltransferase involved in cell wall biosynthesis
LPGSAAVANVIATHKRKHTWHTQVDTFIALSAFSRDVFIRAGVPAEKIVIKPNCVEDPRLSTPQPTTVRKGALFVGRLSEEKGVRVLLKIWKDLDVPLKIIGDGPLRAEVDQTAQRNPAIEICGFKPTAEIYAAMQQAQVLVLPSICYENFPITLAEAYASQLPVMASNIGSLACLVGENEGWLIAPDDVQGWRDTLRTLTPYDIQIRGKSARKVYEETYTPEANLKLLEAIYTAA